MSRSRGSTGGSTGGGSVFSRDRKRLYLFVHEIPREGIMVKGVDTPYTKASILSSGQELRIQEFSTEVWVLLDSYDPGYGGSGHAHGG